MRRRRYVERVVDAPPVRRVLGCSEPSRRAENVSGGLKACTASVQFRDGVPTGSPQAVMNPGMAGVPRAERRQPAGFALAATGGTERKKRYASVDTFVYTTASLSVEMVVLPPQGRD
jgi:hypothetical protein